MRKLFVSGAISAMGLLLAAGNVFAATTIAGNGAFSHNTVWSKTSFASLTSQSNLANLNNQIKIGSWKSGSGNTANNNTGGSVDQSGGGSDAVVGINNAANKNKSTGINFPCFCEQLNTDLSIVGNGANSDNKIKVSSQFVTQVEQTNTANINNSVHVGGSTGGNTANDNTNTDVSQSSGDSSASVTVNNVVNSNTAN